MILITYLICIALLTSAFMIIIFKNSLHSVLSLVFTFLSASLLLFIFENEFLALFFLIIYLGAIAILFLFVIMMLNIKYRELQINKQYFPLGILIGFSILFEIHKTFSPVFSKNTNFNFTNHNILKNWYDNLNLLPDIYVFGQILYTHYVLQVLIAGLILYIAVIGVAFLTVKVSSANPKSDQFTSKQLSRTHLC
jgi:NADH-quinone oxidoreductase subunit J